MTSQMKLLRSYSNPSRYIEYKRKRSSKRSDAYLNDRPTPLNFDEFIPWYCREIQVPQYVIVTRKYVAKYITYSARHGNENSKSSEFKRRSKVKFNSFKSDISDRKSVSTKPDYLVSSVSDIQDVIHVTSYYNKRDCLVEIAIDGCYFNIPGKIIQAFNICLPFHLELSKLSIRKVGLSNALLCEISKLLPYSNITDVCLDDSSFTGSKFSILLEQPSQLRYLSLKRCNINDDECKKIARKLDVARSAVQRLLLLDLTCNEITDEGAKDLGEALKRNRSILYLNLSGNRLSDTGAAYILKYLMEFPLTNNDIQEKWKIKYNYLKSKILISDKCLEKTNYSSYFNTEQKSSLDNVHKKGRRRTRISLPKLNIKERSSSDIEDAENKVKELLGDFKDPYNEENTKRKDNFIYSIGNLTLCSLNLAYNDITGHTVKKLLKVLKYQLEIENTSHGTGLLRVVIEGNRIICPSNELDELDLCLTVLKERELNM